jgi:hypothetical protein
LTARRAIRNARNSPLYQYILAIDTGPTVDT